VEQVQGIVDRVKFSGDQFSIISLIDNKTKRSVTALINSNVVVGECLLTTGIWTHHDDHGRQFKVKEFSRNIPASEDGVLALLSSGLIKGIGPKTAKSMVETYGTSVTSMIERRDARLTKIPGIGPKRLLMIEKQWHQFYGREHIIGMLANNGFSIHLIRRITQEYGDEMIEKLRNNPYSLTRLPGIGFYRADRFARSLGVSEKHPMRIQEGIMLLLENNDGGHTYIPRAELYARFFKIIKFTDSELTSEEQDAIFEEGVQNLVIKERIIQEEDQIHSAYLYACESNIASSLIERVLKEQVSKYTVDDIMPTIESWEISKGIILTKPQRNAVVRSFLDRVLVITGSPGSGKTSTLAAVLEVADSLNLSCELCAPTGRAAKRMQEATGKEASTIHRLLEFGGDGDFRFKYNSTNKLETDLVIVDEVSMVDVSLMSALLNALAEDTRIILVGDHNQLQSVSAGNVLHDIIDSGKVTVIELVYVFRQDADALLIQNAHRINAGHVRNNKNPLTSGKKWGKDDFFITHNVSMDNIVDIATKHIPSKYGIPVEEVLFLTPIRKDIGKINCTNLNIRIQKEYNENGKDIPVAGNFKVGDKVMQMRNNYTKNVFNGDVGMITKYALGNKVNSGAVWVDFYGIEVAYDFVESNELTLAYASTIHKAQGSEADAVIVILPNDFASRNMLTRNLLYTGVTRAKKVCVLVSEDAEINRAIRKSGNKLRYTDLKDKVIRAYFKYENRNK